MAPKQQYRMNTSTMKTTLITETRLGFLLVTLALVAMLSGCATSDFHQYTGAQQNWPIASGAFVTTKYDVPAYYGPPDRPYIVLGSLDATTVRGIGQDES